MSRAYDVLILGGGLAGLSCGLKLSGHGKNIAVIEKEKGVGGLARTIEEGEFRFDLGGHRFFTKNIEIQNFLEEILGDQFIEVGRSSKIFMMGKYFDYPLRAANAFLGMGPEKSFKIILDYAVENIKKRLSKTDIVSLEDWVVQNFGRSLFEIYFKDYSEKVWGIDCSYISKDWVSQRINGLSLGKAMKKAFLGNNKNDCATLIKKFIYPREGIGVLSREMKRKIEEKGRVFTELKAERISIMNNRVVEVKARNCKSDLYFEAENFISSLPVNLLVNIIKPRAPSEVLRAADKLKFRDTVIVTVFINKHKATEESWIYFPEKDIPFGRLHEPKNWSSVMAPKGKTSLVVEYFSSRGEKFWQNDDEKLIKMTAEKLVELGYFEKHELLGGKVIRVRDAYPLFKVGYKEELGIVRNYLENIENLITIGRSGRFEYYNMDHALESGIKAAEIVLGKNYNLNKVLDNNYLEEMT